MNARRQKRSSPQRLLALLIFGIALAAGGALWGLRRLYHRQSHSMATRDVVALGTAIARHLASQPEIRSSEQGIDWRRFGALVEALYTVEPGLRHVEVTEEGVVVFHQRSGPRKREQAHVRPDSPAGTATRDIELERKILNEETGDVAVLTFAQEVVTKEGKSRAVEVALRRDTVTREETGPIAATTAMFEVAVATVAVAFGFCIALVLWVMRREEAVERQRHTQEHLAFAGAIAGGVVHDFRNPLSSLKLDIQMLKEEAAGVPSEPAQAIAELADHATHTAGRMEDILDQFLSLSTPGQEKKTPVDVGACARECLRILEPRLKRHGALLNVDIPSAAVVVDAYAISLRRAIINILTNAEEHSPAGGWVAVQLRPAGGLAVLDISDSGPGVPEAERERVFEMFVSSRPGGTGLGLYLARSAVEKCEGTLEIVDTGSGGCCFRIMLPLKNAGEGNRGNALETVADGALAQQRKG